MNIEVINVSEESINSGRLEKEECVPFPFPFPKRAIMFQRRQPFRAMAGCLEGMFTYTCKFSTRAASLNWVQYPPWKRRREESLPTRLFLVSGFSFNRYARCEFNLLHSRLRCPVSSWAAHLGHQVPHPVAVFHPTLEVMGGHKLWATGRLAQMQEQIADARRVCV